METFIDLSSSLNNKYEIITCKVNVKKRMAATTMVSILFYQYTRLQGTIIPFFVFLSIAHSTFFLSSKINGKFRSSFYSFYFLL